MKTDGQIGLFEVLTPETPPTLPQSVSLNPDSFGCCSSYRACSDARQCVISDRDYSANCLYRRNLESGRIFYGKNANGFNQSQYAELRQRVDSLSPDARSAFDSILIDFCDYHRAAHRLIVRNKYIPELSAVGLFEFRVMGAEFPRLCSHRSFLKPAVMSHPEYGPLFRKAQAERGRDKQNQKIPKANSKEFLLYWLNHDGVSLRDLMSEPYRFAVLSPENILYSEELYQDTLFSGCADRIYPLSPFAEDGLLSPTIFEEEESRRVKLSLGYSPAEKEQQISKIHEKSAAYTGNLDRYNPFWGKMCVITGVLSRMSRSDAFTEICNRSGRVSDTPVNSMDILILGYQEWSALNGGIASRKVQKAVDLQKSGKNIKIISEDEFYSMLEKIPV